jgi:hypothetical protein
MTRTGRFRWSVAPKNTGGRWLKAEIGPSRRRRDAIRLPGHPAPARFPSSTCSADCCCNPLSPRRGQAPCLNPFEPFTERWSPARRDLPMRRCHCCQTHQPHAHIRRIEPCWCLPVSLANRSLSAKLLS